jgi:hypothetical protein
LQLHRWSLVGWLVFNFNHKLNRSKWISDAFFLAPSTTPRRFELKQATGRAVEPLARARLRSNNSTPLTSCLFTHKCCYRPLFRFTGNGTRNFDPFGTSVYFSVDDGATVLKYFYPDITTGDAQDWASGATPDSYDAYLYDGLQGDLTTNDLMALDVLGYNSPGVKAAHVTGTALTKSSFQISFTNLAATSYAILATTNLTLPTTSWTVLGTAIENPVGQYAFTDPYATNRLRFYRVRSP